MLRILIIFLLAVSSQIYSNDKESLYLKGLQFYQDKKFLPAIGSFKKSLENPEKWEKDYLNYFYLGNCYFINEDYDKSLEYFSQSLLVSSPEDFQADVYLNMGFNYTAKRDFSNSLEYYSKAFSLDSNRVIIYRYKGLAYLHLRDRQNTINEWENYVNLVSNGTENDIREVLKLLKSTNFYFPRGKDDTNYQTTLSNKPQTVPENLIDIEGLLDQIKPADKGKASDQSLEGIEK